MLGQPIDVSGDARAQEIRRCAKCSQPEARCVHVTVHRYRGIIPSGRTYEHVCSGCGAKFETLSPLRFGLDVMFSLLMLPISLVVGLVAVDGPWWSGVVAGLLFLGALWFVFKTARAVFAQVRNPVA